MKSFSLLLMVLALAGSAAGNDTENPFPVPEELEPRVQFWVDVFTKYSIHQRIIHDEDKPERIYQILDLSTIYPDQKVTKQQEERILTFETERIVAILKRLASGKVGMEQFTDGEKRIYRLFGKQPKRQDLLRASRSVRVQNGMRETFKDGIVRSGRYLSTIERILEDHELPEELAYLPHIESSFNHHARSKYGAVGIWQFTRATGKYYLKIRRELDERRDPILSTEAAAKLLRTNFRTLRTWPLAVMAYNYGLSGIRRAVRKLGTKDVGKIIRSYRSRRFGFASKNFYLEFVAATRIAKDPSRFFGSVALESAMRFKTVKLTTPRKLESILREFGVTVDDINRLNPALRPPIFREERAIPRGYLLRLPLSLGVLANADSIPGEGSQGDSTSGVSKSPGEIIASVVRELKLWTGAAESFDENKNIPSGIQETDSHSPVEEKMDSTQVPVLPNRKVLLEVRGEVVIVHPEETLGHYADWLEISTQKLRHLNGLRYGHRIRIGQRVRLSYEKVEREIFEERRRVYHQRILEDFFRKYRIENSVAHTVRHGETLWTMAKERFDVPLWLLLAYNDKRDPNRVIPGETVIVPIVKRIESVSSDGI
jgi:membrane-bound lytic murein transglycosylase D